MSFALLKEEINQTHNTIYDITKWKLILVSSICAVALGLTKDPAGDFHLLLLLLPLVCAYSDLLYYQNLLRIFVLATFIRQQDSWDSIVEYEKIVCKTRTNKVFNLELWSQLLSSLVFSLAAIVALYLEVQHPTFSPKESLWPWRIFSGSWAAGVALILWVYLLFRQRNHILDHDEDKVLDHDEDKVETKKGKKLWFMSSSWNVKFWVVAVVIIAVAAYQLPVMMSKLPNANTSKPVATPTPAKQH